MIEIWFYIKMQLKLNHASWGRELNFRVLPVKRLKHHTYCRLTKIRFLSASFLFVILHNWRAWIIYNSQIIFWMVSASGRQRGNFNDVPGRAKPSFTVSQPEKLPAEHHPLVTGRDACVCRRGQNLHSCNHAYMGFVYPACLFQFWQRHLHKNWKTVKTSLLN